MVDEVQAAVGSAGLSLLVNNAGIMEKCSTQMFGVPLKDLEPEMFRNVLETNTIAPLMLIKVRTANRELETRTVLRGTADVKV